MTPLVLTDLFTKDIKDAEQQISRLILIIFII